MLLIQHELSKWIKCIDAHFSKLIWDQQLVIWQILNLWKDKNILKKPFSFHQIWVRKSNQTHVWSKKCWKQIDTSMRNVFQSFFCHWCQTCYFLARQLLIWFKYYHLFDWWRRFDQKDVTKEPRGRVDLWYERGVQESAKIVITWCIDNLPNIAKVGYSKQVQHNKLH